MYLLKSNLDSDKLQVMKTPSTEQLTKYYMILKKSILNEIIEMILDDTLLYIYIYDDEEYLWRMMMIKNIQFTSIKNDFQTKLKNDISDIQKHEKVLIPADKSRNICRVVTADYKKNFTWYYNKTKSRIKEKLTISIKIKKW